MGSYIYVIYTQKSKFFYIQRKIVIKKKKKTSTDFAIIMTLAVLIGCYYSFEKTNVKGIEIGISEKNYYYNEEKNR